jgi:hypothetical protein
MKPKMVELPEMLQFLHEVKKGGFMMGMKSAHFNLYFVKP